MPWTKEERAKVAAEPCRCVSCWNCDGRGYTRGGWDGFQTEPCAMSNRLIVMGPSGCIGKFSLGACGEERRAIGRAISAIRRDIESRAMIARLTEVR